MAPLATVDDVRVEVETDLDDDKIEKLLERVARDIDREYGSEPPDKAFADEPHRQDFEAALTAYRIVSNHDRKYTEESVAQASKRYDGSVIDFLKERVARLDPKREFTGPPDKHVSLDVPDSRGVDRR